jgi:ubiquinone/menaquinone biosynthesis C-methylase UbiE
MGSQAIQGKLWGQHPADWANIQEVTSKAGYDFVLNHLSLASATRLLDVGCGTGYFCSLANAKGIKNITGLDATSAFIEEAKKRLPAASFMVGEMEELPFKEESFEVVCGFNSFQYAANTKNALTEAKRVLVKGGKLVAMIWGNKEDCQAASYLKAVGSLLPPPPPGAAGPFALSENNLLEKLLEEVGLNIMSVTDVVAVWDYPNMDIALRGLLSAGPAAKAIEYSGFEKVYETLSMAVRPYLQTNGHVVYHNKFRVVISKK